MATFRVGQRVRIKWSNGWPELSGEEGTIVGPSSTPGLRGESEWYVSPDCWGTHIAPYPGVNGGCFFGPNSCQLEPLDKPKEKQAQDSHSLAGEPQGSELGSWDALKELGLDPEKLLDLVAKQPEKV